MAHQAKAAKAAKAREKVGVKAHGTRDRLRGTISTIQVPAGATIVVPAGRKIVGVNNWRHGQSRGNNELVESLCSFRCH